MKIFVYCAFEEKAAFLKLEEVVQEHGKYRYSVTGEFHEGRRLGAQWVAPQLQVTKRKGEYTPDFANVSGSVPVFSERAWKVMAPLLGQDVEALPMHSKAGTFYAINILRSFDCLVMEKCAPDYYEDRGMIRRVGGYVFKPEFVPPAHMFMVCGISISDVLITNEFKNRAEHHGLRGLTPKLAQPPILPLPLPPEEPFVYEGRPNEFGQLKKAQLAAFEKAIGYSLPEDYREYLRAYNGGLPRGAEVRDVVLPGKRSVFGELIRAYGLHRGPEMLRLDWEWKFVRSSMPAGMVPFADDAGGSLFCLGCAGKSRGKVYYWDHELEDEPARLKNFQLLTESFTEFLNCLRPVK